jgi:hypothetical protein
MIDPLLKGQNLQKFLELTQVSYEPCFQAQQDCFDQGYYFQVLEAYRPQARQDALWLIGRRGRKGEAKVTWTKTSNHTNRLAFDIRTLFTPEEKDTPTIMTKDLPAVKLRKRAIYSYTMVADVLAEYGILRQIDLIALGDFGHFNVDKAHTIKPSPVIIGKEDRINGLTRRLKTEKDPVERERIGRLLDRLGQRK